MIHSLRLRVGLFVGIGAIFIGGFWLISGPIPQPNSYHDFADQRPLFGVPHSLNVLSNFPFVLVGALGLAFMASSRSRQSGVFIDSAERWPYWAYFVGLVITGFASSYYHANPNNATLVCDRIGLALTLTALFTAILAERLHPACARYLLVPMLLLGAGSVLYWDWTERHGAGDLRLYFTVQFFPLIVLPLLLFLYPPRYTRGGDLFASLVSYGLAKGLEMLDRQVYTAAGIVSGHTLKHLVAGLSAAFILLMLWKRQPYPKPAPGAQAAALAVGQT